MSRVLRFADSAVRVDAHGEEIARLVDFAFGRVPTREGAAPHTSFEIASDARGCVVSQDGAAPGVFESAGDALEHLVGECTRELVDRASGGLVLHAAAVERAGSVTLLAGASGAGKTTLTARLLTRDFSYLTDEVVWVRDGTLDAQPFSRPLSVKSGAIEAISALISRSDASLVVPWSFGALYDPRAFGEAAAASQARIARILFPVFERGATFALERLSEGRAVQEVLGVAANARNVSRHGLGEAGRIARSVPAYRLVYGGFGDLGPLDALLARDEGTP